MATKTKTRKLNYFQELEKVDVTNHIEKKGRFSYLSWTFAVRELRRKHPTATWRVVKHVDNDGIVLLPYLSSPAGNFVEVEVTVDDISMTQIHPVLDHRNKPILKPNAFDINTSIQRCLVKAIALHGLGLHIYAGEDLPPDDKPTTRKTSVKNATTRRQHLTTVQKSEIVTALEAANVSKETYGKVMEQVEKGGIHKDNFDGSLSKIKQIVK